MTFFEAMKRLQIFPHSFDEINIDGLREVVAHFEEEVKTYSNDKILYERYEAYKMLLEFLEKRATIFEDATEIYRLCDTLYFSCDREDSIVLAFNIPENEWLPRDSVSFWDAWDDGPLLYEIVKLEDAKKLVKEAGKSHEKQ